MYFRWNREARDEQDVAMLVPETSGEHNKAHDDFHEPAIRSDRCRK